MAGVWVPEPDPDALGAFVVDQMTDSVLPDLGLVRCQLNDLAERCVDDEVSTFDCLVDHGLLPMCDRYVLDKEVLPWALLLKLTQ